MRFSKKHFIEEIPNEFSIETPLNDAVKDLINHQSNIIHAPILDRPNSKSPLILKGRSRSLPNIGPTPPVLSSKSSGEIYRSTDKDSGPLSDTDESDEDESKIDLNENRNEFYTQSHRNIDRREQSLPSSEWIQNILLSKTSQESSTSILDAISSSLHGAIKSVSLSPKSDVSTKWRKYDSILKKSRYGDDGDHCRSKTVLNAKFTTLEIREFPVALGDNPGGIVGPPICLDWKHEEERTLIMSLEEYESTREPRKEGHELWIPECLRRWKLLDKGVSMRAMQKAAKKADKARAQRKSTIASFRKTPAETGLFSGAKDIFKHLKVSQCNKCQMNDVK